MVACSCSVVGLGRMKQVQKAPKQRYLEGRVKSAGFPCPMGYSELNSEDVLENFLMLL